MAKLYDMMATNMVIGCLYKNPSLYFNENYKLNLEDFHDPELNRGFRFQRILFGCGYQLAKSGVKEVSAIDVGEYMKNYKENMVVLEDNDYMEAIDIFKEMADENSFEFYYKRVRILSLLADYKYKKGHNIDKFFNVDGEEQKEMAKLEKYTMQDIIDYFDIENADLRQEYLMNEDLEYYKAGDDFIDTVNKLKENALLGSPFQSQFLNELFGGQLGLVIFVAKSAGGKSIFQIGNMCNVSALEWWNDEKKQFEKNKHFSGGSVFINTELSLREEVDIMCVASISGVDRGKIRRWTLTEEEESRVMYASKILKESPIYLTDDANFTKRSLESTVKDHVLKYGIKHVFFDYLQNQSYLAREITQEQSIAQREDMILLNLTTHCKNLSKKYSVYFGTSVQSNGNEDTTPYPTESCLAGSKGQVRKTDATIGMFGITKAELESYEKWYEKNFKTRGFNVDHIKPNYTFHVIKGRATKYDRHTKCLVYLDLGTGRVKDLLCLDKNNKPINVEKLEILGGH